MATVAIVVLVVKRHCVDVAGFVFPGNSCNSLTEEAVESFLASLQAQKVDVMGGSQQRLQEQGIQVEVGGAQDEGMMIGRGAVG